MDKMCVTAVIRQFKVIIGCLKVMARRFRNQEKRTLSVPYCCLSRNRGVCVQRSVIYSRYKFGEKHLK